MAEHSTTPLRSDDVPSPDRARYERPAVEVLGTLESLTQGPIDIGGDLNGQVISF